MVVKQLALGRVDLHQPAERRLPRRNGKLPPWSAVRMHPARTPGYRARERVPAWRNWQTQTSRRCSAERPCGFDSHRRHPPRQRVAPTIPKVYIRIHLRGVAAGSPRQRANGSTRWPFSHPLKPHHAPELPRGPACSTDRKQHEAGPQHRTHDRMTRSLHFRVACACRWLTPARDGDV